MLFCVDVVTSTPKQETDQDRSLDEQLPVDIGNQLTRKLLKENFHNPQFTPIETPGLNKKGNIELPSFMCDNGEEAVVDIGSPSNASPVQIPELTPFEIMDGVGKGNIEPPSFICDNKADVFTESDIDNNNKSNQEAPVMNLYCEVSPENDEIEISKIPTSMSFTPPPSNRGLQTRAFAQSAGDKAKSNNPRGLAGIFSRVISTLTALNLPVDHMVMVKIEIQAASFCFDLYFTCLHNALPSSWYQRFSSFILLAHSCNLSKRVNISVQL